MTPKMFYDWQTNGGTDDEFNSAQKTSIMGFLVVLFPQMFMAS
jgi:hypothetical protein